MPLHIAPAYRAEYSCLTTPQRIPSLIQLLCYKLQLHPYKTPNHSRKYPCLTRLPGYQDLFQLLILSPPMQVNIFLNHYNSHPY